MVVQMQPGLTDEQMTLAIDRMGHLVLGIKHLFDMHCDDGTGELNADQASGLLTATDYTLISYTYTCNHFT